MSSYILHKRKEMQDAFLFLCYTIVGDEMKPKKTVTAMQLKWLTAILMLWDHVAKFMMPFLMTWMSATYGFSDELSYGILLIGTGFSCMTFFILAYLCAQSCRYTKHRVRYLRNLFLFALLSEVPFQFMIQGMEREALHLSLGFTNVLVTMLLGALSCFIYDELEKRNQKVLGFGCALLLAILANTLGTDYGFFGVMDIFMCFVCKEKKHQLLALGIGILLQYGVFLLLADIVLYGFSWIMFLAYSMVVLYSLCSLLILNRYQGERGNHSKFKTYFFYVFYPLHMSILVGIYALLM